MTHNLCGACQSTKLKPVLTSVQTWQYPGKQFQILRCEQCGVGILDPQVSFAEMEKELYTQQYHAYQPYHTPRRGLRFWIHRLTKHPALHYFLGYGSKHFWQFFFYPFFLRLAFYPKKKDQGRFLDIGCGVGKYLHYLKQLSWDVYGIDVSQQAIVGARLSGLQNVRQGEVKTAGFDADFFDVVNFHHVFEHVPDPNEVLQTVHRITKPGGEIIITVPNFGSLAAKLFRKKWGGMDVPRHLFHYNRKSLDLLLRRNGFEPFGHYFSDTVRGLMSGLANVFFKDGRGHEKYFLPFGILLDLIIDPIGNLFGWGDQMTVKARKM